MQLGRRGFLGILAGTVLGKVVGPKLTASPGAPEAWQKAVEKAAFLGESEASYAPLELMANRVLEVVGRELKWLRMQQFDDSDTGWNHKIGDTVHVRAAEAFRPSDFAIPPYSLSRVKPVTLDRQCSIDMPGDTRLDQPWDMIDSRLIEPTGLKLAERIINDVRRNGGADYMISAKPAYMGTVDRCLIASSPEAHLSLRAISYCDPSEWFAQKVRLDMLYGVA